MYLSAESLPGQASLWGDGVGALGGPLPAEVQQFVDTVSKEPAKHTRLLLSISNRLNPLPVETLSTIMKGTQPAAFKAIQSTADPASVMKDLRTALAGVLLQHKGSDAKFASLATSLEDVSNRVDTAVVCVITYRRLRQHFPRIGTTPVQPDVPALVKRGKGFIHDKEFQNDFPRLAREIRKSGFPEIIFLSTGLNLFQAAVRNKQDHEGFKKAAAQVCKTRREQEKQK